MYAAFRYSPLFMLLWLTNGRLVAADDVTWVDGFTNDPSVHGTWISNQGAPRVGGRNQQQGTPAVLNGHPGVVSVGRLVSPVYHRGQGSFCLAFTYTLTPRTKLTVMVKSEDLATESIWALGSKGNTDIGPQSAEVDVTGRSHFQLIFEGQVGPSTDQHVTVSDVAILDRSCQSYGVNCTFDDGFCGYQLDTSERLRWKRAKGKVADIRGPSADHTSGTGYYLYVSDNNQAGARARISSPPQPSTRGSPVCLTFWFHMFGGTSGALNVHLTSGYTRLPVWSRSGSHANVWRKGQRTVTSTMDYQITFEAVMGDMSSVIVAIDDVVLTGGRCPTEPMCDFEADTCDLYTDGDDLNNFAWRRGSNGTGGVGTEGTEGTGGTGPAVDHTTGTAYGHYMFIKHDQPKKGAVSRVIMYPYTPTEATQCVHFWYYTNGTEAPGTLSLYVRRKSVMGAPVWTERGTTDAGWDYGQVVVSSGGSEWELLFTAVSEGPSRRGTLALDDVRVSEGPCPSPASCDFETDLCGYQRGSRDQSYSWFRSAGRGLRRGPSVDHTTNSDTGFYVFADASVGSAHQRAHLTSEYVQPAQTPSCLRFWYHAYAAAQCRLEVYLVPREGPALHLTTLGVSDIDVWIRKDVSVQYNNQFRIRFESVVGPNGVGEISLDDLLYTPGVPCGLTTTSATSTSTPLSTTAGTSIYDCTFDNNNLCSWKHGNNSQVTFDLERGLDKEGPKVDHSLGSNQGYYIIFRKHYVPANQTARIISPLVTTSGGSAKCFRFWYHIFGSKVNRLNIRFIEGQAGPPGAPIWQRLGTQEDVWTYGQVGLPGEGAYSVVVEAVSGDNWSGDISVDDVSVIDGPCPTQDGVCDFEAHDQCGYVTDKAAELQWKRGGGDAGTSGDQPRSDHTYGTTSGHYMFVSTPNPSTSGQRALLISPTHSATTGRCLRWWYRVQRDSNSTLSVHIRRQGTSQRLWTQPGEATKAWRVAQLTLNSNSKFEVIFEVLTGWGSGTTISLDDVTLTVDRCPAPASCDFEADRCTYTADQGGDFQWVRHRGDALTPGVGGPLTDHTKGTDQGWYMFMNVHRGHGKGDAGRFRSELIPGGGGGWCLSFWYLASGRHAGTLRVYTETFPTASRSNVFEMVNPGVSPSWTFEQTSLFARADRAEFWVVFEGETGYGSEGGLGVDDVRLTPGRCSGPTPPPTPFDCGNGVSISAQKVCDFHVDCPDGRDEADCGNCTFEAYSFCSWTDRSRGSFRWSVGRGSELTNTSGPPTDHSTGTADGQYAYVAPGKGEEKALATLESRLLQQAGSSCRLRLWYHMEGVDIGSLQVSVRLANTNQHSLLWHRSGSQGPRWLQAEARLPRLTGPYTLVVQAQRSFSVVGHIAVDDVSITSCGLPPTVHGPCPPGWERCSRGSCYDPQTECDFTDDCGDFTDESPLVCGKYPLRCDFEYGTCGWYQAGVGNGGYAWKRQQGATPLFGTGPSRDHTSGFRTGWYMYTDASRSKVTGEEAILMSPTWDDTINQSQETPCYMTFYYHMLGDHIGGLKMYRLGLSNGEEEKIFSEYGDHGDIWNRGLVFLNSSQPFAIKVISIRGSGDKGDIALDDVSFSPGCTLHVGPPITPPPPTTPTTPKATPAPCPGGWRHCRNNQCVKSEDFCNFRYDCADGSDEDNCPQTCTFEGGDLCSWNSSTDKNKPGWKVISGGGLKEGEGPLRDHTLNSKDGQYAYLNNAAGGSAAQLTSPTYHQSGLNCQFSFWYSINGGPDLKLVLFDDEDKERLMWEITYGQKSDSKWKRVRMTIPVCSKRFKLQFTGEVMPEVGSVSYIAIDDIRFDSCEYPLPPPKCPAEKFACKSGHCVAPELKCDFQSDCCDGSDEKSEVCKNYDRCDFESGFCNLIHITKGKLAWVRFKASQGPGPARDHTLDTQNGHYVNFKPGNSTQGARLAYNLNATGTSTPCTVRFWYSSTERSAIKIYKRTSLTGREEMLGTFRTDKMVGRVWSRGSVDLTSTKQFQVILEASADVASVKGGQSVSLDDTSFTNGCIPGSGIPVTPAPTLPPACPSNRFTCGDGSCIHTYKVCDFYKDCPEGEDERTCPSYCDFEQDQCGWNETHNNGFDWRRGSGAETKDTPDMAPRRDHTLSGAYGHYMYLRSDVGNVVKNKQNELVSATFRKSLASCRMQFFYYIDGIATGVVKVVVRREDKEDLLLWSTKGSVAPSWRFSRVGLGKRERPFQVVIIREPTYRYRGTVAVDDVRFSGCAPPPARAACSQDRFWCVHSRACISMDKFCDLEDDCGDTSDEDLEQCAAYTRVDFEEGLQLFRQGRDGPEDDFDWTWGSGATATSNTGPSFDHTTGRETGRYFYIKAKDQPFGQRAWLVSRTFLPTTDGLCTMRIWYHMYGAHVNKLAVYSRLTQNGRPHSVLWERQGPVGAYWERAQFDIVLNDSFSIVIEATVGDWRYGDVAIDDVTFTPACRSDNRPLPTATATPPAETTRVTTVAHACSKEEFNCHNSGKCLARDRVCDFRIDCVDGSDESHCTHPFCNFEDGEMCNWVPQQTSDGGPTYRWTPTPAGAPSVGRKYRPEVDHTTGRPSGWYLYADSSPGNSSSRAELWSATISRTGPQCKLTFWFHMAGFHVGSLHVIADSGHQGRHQLWYQSGPKRDAWQLAEVFLGPRTDFWVVIEARRGRSYQGDISIDDVSFGDCEPPVVGDRACSDSEFECSNKYCIDKQYVCDYADHCGDRSDEQHAFCDHTYVYRCDFEFNLCPTWHQDQDDDFDWTLTQGGTTNPATGPHGDHTTGQGSYLFIESTYSVKKGDLARLSSNFIKGTSKDCHLRFWYHMKGDNIGSLSVLMRYVDKKGTTQQVVLYNVTGEQGDLWQRGRVNLSPYIQDKADFQVVVQASVGGRARGDIALDDLSLAPGCEAGAAPSESPPTSPRPHSCDRFSLPCGDGGCYRPSQRCNFVRDCTDGTDERDCGGDCDFEADGLCGWRNSYRSTLDWIRRSGPTPTANTGPSTDHTTHSPKGHYMYIETSAAKTGDRAHLESALYRMSGAKCRLTFYYHMYGVSVGRLSVYVKMTSQSTASVYDVTGNMGDSWQKVDAWLGHRRDFVILFEATRGDGDRGDIALDDIKFEDCKPDTNLAVCRGDEFLCRDQSQCIERRYLCDRKVDCRDGSDENLNMCPGVRGSCDFEGRWQKVCGWRQADDDDADWGLGETTPAPATGPGVDHTVGRGGHFLYIDSLKMDTGEVARVSTPEYPASYGLCHVRFWYHMYGDQGMGTLQVFTRSPSGQRVLVWRRSGNHGDQWQYANLGVGSNHNFSLVFEAIRGDSLKSDIAIDDVTFTPSCVTGEQRNITDCLPDQFYCQPQVQCMPNTWKCDGEVDCQDGSDESNCNNSVVSGSTVDPRRFWTVGPQSCKVKGQFRCVSGACVPANLYCDGVSDCEQGDDEYGCRRPCRRSVGETYCGPTASCLPPEARCDGRTDCPDGSDEAGCTECMPKFCQNNGRCWIQERFGVNCNCSNTGYDGYRCQYKIETAASPTPNIETHNGVKWLSLVLAAVSGVLLVICLVLAIYVSQMRRKSLNYKRHSNMGWDNQHIDNPLYEMSDNMQTFHTNNNEEPPKNASRGKDPYNS